MCSLYYDLRSLIIGKRFSTEDLGYYDRGQQFPFTINFALDASVQSVMFPCAKPRTTLGAQRQSSEEP